MVHSNGEYKDSADLAAQTLIDVTKDNKLIMRYKNQFTHIVFINCYPLAFLHSGLASHTL